MKLTYKAGFSDGRLTLKIYSGSVLLDEITFPSLPTYTLALATQTLWKSFFTSLNEED